MSASCDSAVVLERTHGRDDDRRLGAQAGLAALDVDELLGTEVGTEAGLGHDVVGELERRRRGDDRVAAVRDVGERTAVDERRGALEGLHEVGAERVLEQHGHRALGLQVVRGDGPLLARVAHDDVAEATLEVLERGREAEDRHDLAGDDDVEAVLARVAVGRAAQRDGDVAQRAVVEVDDALPRDPAYVDAQLVAVVDVVVDERGEQVVGELDRAEVAGEVEVDVLHRDDLGVAAAGGAALHAEHRAERRLAEADHGVLADTAETVAEADSRRGLALAGRRGADGRHQDEVRPLARGLGVEPVQADLGLVVAIGVDRVVGDVELRGDGADPLHLGGLGDLDVGEHVYSFAARVAATSAGRMVCRSPTTA